MSARHSRTEGIARLLRVPDPGWHAADEVRDICDGAEAEGSFAGRPSLTACAPLPRGRLEGEPQKVSRTQKGGKGSRVD
jgi:hypothetical protein